MLLIACTFSNNGIIDYCNNSSQIGLLATLKCIFHTAATVILLKGVIMAWFYPKPCNGFYFTLGKEKSPHHGYKAPPNLNPQLVIWSYNLPASPALTVAYFSPAAMTLQLLIAEAHSDLKAFTCSSPPALALWQVLSEGRSLMTPYKTNTSLPITFTLHPHLSFVLLHDTHRPLT